MANLCIVRLLFYCLASLFFGNSLLNESSECPCFRARLSSRRENCPQAHRWQPPILKHGHRRPGFQFWREQPFGAANGHTEACKHSLANALRGANTETATYSDSDVRCPLAKGPSIAAGASLFVNDGLMRDEITGGLRHAPRFEVRARADNERSALSDSTRREGRVGKIAKAQCHIYARFNRVDVAVVKNDIDVERGMLGQENGKKGNDVQTGKGHRRGNAQSSLQCRGIAPRGSFRLDVPGWFGA